MALVTSHCVKPAARELERVAGPHLVERQPRERGHALARLHGERSAKFRPGRVVVQRHFHGVAGGGLHVAVSVFDRRVQAEAAFTTTLAGGCWVITTCVAAAGVTVMALVVALLRPLLETWSV